jgi:deoxyribodipyrimidine photo-lyase
MAALVWFRDDLRLEDNPALAAAARSRDPILPLYVLDESVTRPAGGASRWWLHHSLAAFDARLRAASARGEAPAGLILRRGDTHEILPRLCAQAKVTSVHWNRGDDPHTLAGDRKLENELRAAGIEVRVFERSLLVDPDRLRTRGGTPFKVFTPFWNALCALEIPAPIEVPARLTGLAQPPDSDALEAWGLLPRPDWAGGFQSLWTPGVLGAQARLRRFLDAGLSSYPTQRDYPADEGTSRLSPHLRFGEISPRQVWHAVRALPGGSHADLTGASFLRELGWREFAKHLLSHEPDLAQRPLRPEFASFPWRDDPAALQAWQQGRTGYPIVDAGMRELWSSGWMHNRVRMITASFLVKHLLVPWQRGEAWFWDTLVDADPANNAMNWQWVAGCGTDAAPYFRIFNPVTQSRRFDPEGAYIRRWVPELAELPDPYIHAPWEAPPLILKSAGIQLGTTYPTEIVEHDVARKRALAAYAQLRSTRISHPSR